MCWSRLLVCALVLSQGGDALLTPIFHFTQMTKTVLTRSAVDHLTAGYRGNRRHLMQQVNLERRDGELNVKIESSSPNPKLGNEDINISGEDTMTRNSSESMEDRTEVSRRRPGVEVEFQMFPSSDRDWFGAEAECREWGGNLAIPDSPVKVAVMRALLLQHNRRTGEDSAAFLGFSDLEAEGHFVTVLGNPLFPSNKSMWSPDWFRADQPDDDKSWSKNGEDCGSLMSNGGINDVPCGYKLPFICETPKDNVTEVERHDDNDDYDNSTLRFFSQPAEGWFSAREACVQWGGHLAIPDTQYKVLKMTKILKSSRENPDYSSAFLGFSDIESEGEFITIYGQQVFNDNASWNPSWFSETQPDDNKEWSEEGEDCGSLHISGGLNDVPCLYRLPYFCDKS